MSTNLNQRMKQKKPGKGPFIVLAICDKNNDMTNTIISNGMFVEEQCLFVLKWNGMLINSLLICY